VVQGNDGDCYLMAALCGLGNMEGLIDRICVIQDQAVGVYGFVFHRGKYTVIDCHSVIDWQFLDGEWQQCIIDDQLYLTAPDYDESYAERKVWDTIDRRDTEEEYRKTHQTGSRALYFARCSDPRETWLPLLEKAYAKAHGDYVAISGGWTGYDN
jgi:Calpain family cysteine protease